MEPRRWTYSDSTNAHYFSTPLSPWYDARIMYKNGEYKLDISNTMRRWVYQGGYPTLKEAKTVAEVIVRMDHGP